jgi:hypothetical protein
MRQNSAYVKMRVSIGGAYLVKKFLLHLPTRFLRTGSVIDASPVQGTQLPVLNHFLVGTLASNVVAHELVLKLPRHLTRRLFAGRAVFPQPLLAERGLECGFPIRIGGDGWPTLSGHSLSFQNPSLSGGIVPALRKEREGRGTRSFLALRLLPLEH